MFFIIFRNSSKNARIIFRNLLVPNFLKVNVRNTARNYTFFFFEIILKL